MRFILALVFGLFPVAAFAQCGPLPFTLTNGTLGDANQVMANFNAVNSCAQQGMPVVATNAAMAALLTANVPQSGIIRLGFAAKGDAPAIVFIPETGTCAVNSRVNDGGSCVNTTSGDGNSFYTIAPIADVREWGAKGDNGTDNTVALQAALNWAANNAIWFPSGIYRISAALVCPTPFTGGIIGAGANDVTILQTNLTADILDCNVGSQNGMTFQGINLKGNAAAFNAPGSSGIGLNLTNLSENAFFANFSVQNMDVGIKINGSFTARFTNFVVRYFQTYGIWVSSTTGTNGGLTFANFKIQNTSFTAPAPGVIANPPNADTQIGIFEQQSAGNQYVNGEIDATGYAMVLQPTANKVVGFDQFSNVYFDTSVNDNIYLDASATGASVSTIHFVNGGAAFSTNGNGFYCFQAVQIYYTGGYLRQNGKNGARISANCPNFFINGTQIDDNNKLAVAPGPSAGHGVAADVGAAFYSIQNSDIGNTGDAAWSQCNGVYQPAGSGNTILVTGNQMSTFGASCAPVAIGATGTAITVRDNTPIGIGSPTTAVSGTTTTPLAAGTTNYLGANGIQTAAINTAWVVPGAGQITGFSCASVAAPGAGQSFTYTLIYNNGLSAFTGSISGAASFSVTVPAAQVVNPFDNYAIQIITSGAAAVTGHRCTVNFSGA